jgi:hypothetical protein
MLSVFSQVSIHHIKQHRCTIKLTNPRIQQAVRWAVSPSLPPHHPELVSGSIQPYINTFYLSLLYILCLVTFFFFCCGQKKKKVTKEKENTPSNTDSKHSDPSACCLTLITRLHVVPAQTDELNLI